MPRYAALLRAVNVGGTGKLLMGDLTRLCHEAGFTDVRTYLASGNVVFDSERDADHCVVMLQDRLSAVLGREQGLVIRSQAELSDLLAANPFADKPGAQMQILFTDLAPTIDMLDGAKGRQSEQMALGYRAVYLFYPDGIGRSRLTLPALAQGTARNLKTVSALAKL